MIKKRRGPKKGFRSATTWTPERASAASKAMWAKRKFAPSCVCRCHKDAYDLACEAWDNCHVRVKEMSQAIRERALKALQS